MKMEQQSSFQSWAEFKREAFEALDKVANESFPEIQSFTSSSHSQFQN